MQADEDDDEARTLRGSSPISISPQRTQAGRDPEATLVLGNMWADEERADMPPNNSKDPHPFLEACPQPEYVGSAVEPGGG